MAAEQPHVELENISCRLNEQTIIKGLALSIGRGEVFSLLGPSGCGKTTTLRIIAGLEPPTTGSIRIGRRDVTRLSPEQRNLGLVFQSYALFPHMNVYENVAFGCRSRGGGEAGVKSRVMSSLELVRMQDSSQRPVYELSGGQQQRVALARALAIEPQVLLLDEPFSNLDARLRVQTREQVCEIVRRLGMTTLLVTHDREEALALSDRIAVMSRGEIEQIGTPREIYYQPNTPQVAGFWGDGNCLPKAALFTSVARKPPFNQEGSHVFFRAEDAEVRRDSRDPTHGFNESDNTIKGHEIPYVWKGTVLSCRFIGSSWQCIIATEVGEMQIAIPGRESPQETGASCLVCLLPSRIHWIFGKDEG